MPAGRFLAFAANFLTALLESSSILKTWSISRVAPRLILVTVR